LGSTGSVGANTLDVVARHPDRYEVFALSAATRVDEMLAQCQRFQPRFAVMASASHGRELARLRDNGIATRVLMGADAIEHHSEP
jgi:1-deoxy-D-xylulose-5-phosphate reductoisomerase